MTIELGHLPAYDQLVAAVYDLFQRRMINPGERERLIMLLHDMRLEERGKDVHDRNPAIVTDIDFAARRA